MKKISSCPLLWSCTWIVIKYKSGYVQIALATMTSWIQYQGYPQTLGKTCWGCWTKLFLEWWKNQKRVQSRRGQNVMAFKFNIFSQSVPETIVFISSLSRQNSDAARIDEDSTPRANFDFRGFLQSRVYLARQFLSALIRTQSFHDCFNQR